MRVVNFSTKYFKASTMPTHDDTFSIHSVFRGLFRPDDAEVLDGDAAVGRAGQRMDSLKGGAIGWSILGRCDRGGFAWDWGSGGDGSGQVT